jgi:hypothetical protein
MTERLLLLSIQSLVEGWDNVKHSQFNSLFYIHLRLKVSGGGKKSPPGAMAPSKLGVLPIEGSWSRSHTTSWCDQPEAEISVSQNTTIKTERYPRPRRDSNPQSQHASGRRPTARPHGSAGRTPTEIDTNLLVGAEMRSYKYYRISAFGVGYKLEIQFERHKLKLFEVKINKGNRRLVSANPKCI